MESGNPLTAPRPSSSALLTVDMQADFVDPRGSSPIPGSREVVPNLADLAAAYRQAGLPILHIIRLYRADGSNAEPVRRPALAAGKQVVVPGTPGARIVPELLDGTGELASEDLLRGEPQWLAPREAVLYKPRWGAFYRTPLEQILGEQGSDTVVVAGCNFPNCPRTTIYEASERDFRIVAVEDALSGLYPRGIEELRSIGVHVARSAAWRDQVAGKT